MSGINGLEDEQPARRSAVGERERCVLVLKSFPEREERRRVGDERASLHSRIIPMAINIINT